MRSRIPIGLLIGVVVAGVAVGVGELAAVLVRPAAAPIIAVGNRVIELTPETVKRWAIRAVGTDDKLLLLSGILGLLVLIGAVVGIVALRDLRIGLAGVGALGLVGVYCALTVAAARGTDVIPTLVGTAAAMAALVGLVRVAPVVGRRGAETSSPPLARRQFLESSGAVAALALFAGVGGRLAQHARFDVAAARDRVTLPPPVSPVPQRVPVGAELGKSGVPWQTPNADFYRIDTALSVPQIAPGDWRLRIHGMVEHPITLTYAELLKRPLVDRWITLCCVSNEIGGNLVGNALFRGALLADLLREAGLSADCDQLVMRSSDGMTIGAPAKAVMDGRDALLAVGMNGRPLPVEHGFPARVVVPGLYGYVSACKWVVDIEATRFDRFQAYWVQGGWAVDPPIRLMSRIDRPSASESVSVGETVAIAGVAWDQHVGVSRVEVQVDDGPWQAARLAAVPSTDTWRQWVLPWTPEKSGRHRLRVRATDADGRVQDDRRRDVFPSGATGWHTITVRAVI